MKKFLLVCFSLVLALGTAWAQERVVSGKVTSEEDATALPGVNIVLKGTTSGSVTDADGNYSINVPAEGGTLVFSFIGFATQEIALGDRTVVNVALGADVAQLNEVVVTGYGTTERRKLTTSVSSVKGSAISQLATPSFVEQLAGRAAGVQITLPSGIVGTAPTINIRGVNSITSGTTPFFVIDGVPTLTGGQSSIINTNPLADLNPQDIESMEILKDGAATAIYGSRAANGVIIITTKRGVKGRKPTLNFSATGGYSEPVNRFDLLNANEFVQVANQKLVNAGQPIAAFNDASIPTSGSTNWQDVIFRKGKFQNYNINTSGANETTSYYFSVGYQKQESNVVANDFERYTALANIDHRANKFLKVGTKISLTHGITRGLNTGSNALSGNIVGAIRAFPNVTQYDPTNATGYNLSTDGQSLGPGANTRAITSSYTNQGFILANNKNVVTNDHLQGNVYGEATIIDGLSVKSQIGIDYFGTKDFQELDPRHGDGRGSNGSIFNQYRTVTTWDWFNTLNYDKTFGDHTIDVIAGLEYTSTTAESFNASGSNFADRFFMTNGLIGGSYANQFSGGDYVPRGFASTFGKLNYSYKDKYLIEGSIRRDGISDLAPKNRYGVFGGGAIGWRISQEDFWKNSGISSKINELKIRGSYATVGNTQIASFAYAGLYGSFKYGAQNGIAFSSAGNDDLRWETSKKLDIGVDIGLFNNKINVTADYFRNDIDDNILAFPYFPTLGIPNNSINRNIGVMRNQGFEVAVSATALNRNGFTWNINVNYTNVNNQVITTLGVNTLDVQGGNINYLLKARIGQPLNTIYGFEYAGVNSANGNPMYVKGNGTVIQRNTSTGSYSVYDPANPTSEATASTLSTSDVNQGGDRKILGKTTPTWFGGMNNNFAYKNFTLDVFLRYSGGNQVYNQTRQDVLLNQDFTNSSRDLLNAWTPENKSNQIPKNVFGQNSFVNQSGLAISRFVEDGSFLRIQNIALGYSFPKTMLGGTNSPINSVKLFVQVQNAFTFTKYKGLDPELGAGLDNNTNPLSRTFTVGINVGL